mmetsp:Transcript_31073/g.58185  ORF Transcript_31073/g.58185 Transcript_31073/m.58185 type:complete len:103 (-) Transcript_31073:103-411(-)
MMPCHRAHGGGINRIGGTTLGHVPAAGLLGMEQGSRMEEVLGVEVHGAGDFGVPAIGRAPMCQKIRVPSLALGCPAAQGTRAAVGLLHLSCRRDVWTISLMS